jgi:hypothetical protein
MSEGRPFVSDFVLRASNFPFGGEGHLLLSQNQIYYEWQEVIRSAKLSRQSGIDSTLYGDSHLSMPFTHLGMGFAKAIDIFNNSINHTINIFGYMSANK